MCCVKDEGVEMSTSARLATDQGSAAGFDYFPCTVDRPMEIVAEPEIRGRKDPGRTSVVVITPSKYLVLIFDRSRPSTPAFRRSIPFPILAPVHV